MSDPTTLQERLLILESSEAGLCDRSIAHRIGRSVATVRKWRRRGTRVGRQGLASHKKMGRPRKGPLCSFPQAVRERLLCWRKSHPGWGPETLLAELKACPEQFAGVPLPSRSSIGRLLKEEGLSRSYEKHSTLPATTPPSTTAPHQLWEMDARANEKVSGVGQVALIAVNDRYSRARLLCYPCALPKAHSHPKTEDYKALLRLAFSEWGLPESLQVDHESVFLENVSKSPFPSRLHLWLCALGVRLCFSRPHRPTDQAITERSHRLWYGQVIEGARFASWEELYEALLKRRPFLNRLLPCATLAHRPPLVAFPEADHSGRPYAAHLEEELLEMGRVNRLLEKGRWFRRVSKDLTVSLGGLVYYLKGAKKGEQVRIIYETSDRHLLFEDESAEVLGRKPIKGLSVGELIGEDLEPYVSPLYYQPRLPFSLAEQGAVRVRETMAA